MSHYGIIKRQRHYIIPEWRHTGVVHYHSKNKILRHGNESDKYKYCFDNIIIETTERDDVVTYWEGEINQPIVLVGESIEIDNEKMLVLAIDKNINGTITYLVNDYQTISPRYDELLAECNKMYDDYSEHLHKKKAEKLKNESWLKSMFRDLFLNNK